MGTLHWPPSAFWSATVYDMERAIAGWKRANGVKDEGFVDLSRDDIAQLRQMMEEEDAKAS